MSFLARFFGAGNAITWAAVQDPTTDSRKKLEPFVALVENGTDLAFLPRSVPAAAGQPGQLRWYFLCRNATAGRRARELMKAFLGPSFVHIHGRLPHLSVADPVEAAVLDAYGAHSFWVAVPAHWPDESPVATAPHEIVRMRLETLAKLVGRRPTRILARRRPVGRVLRDFEFAATAADVETARACLEELAAAGDLTAANRQFLSVRIDGMQQDWDGLLDPARLSELLDLGPPRAVVQVLVDAFYAKYLREFDDPQKAAEALVRFEKLRHLYGRLFRSRAGLSGRSADFCFLLEAAGFADQPGPVIESILSGTPEVSPGRAALLAVAALARRTPTPQVEHDQALNRALGRYNEGDLDEALNLASGGPHGFSRTAVLVRIAAELQTIAAATAALEALALSSEEDLEKLAKNRPLSLAAEKVRELSCAEPGREEVSLPDGWVQWLERLQQPTQWSGAVAAASAGERDWGIHQTTDTAQLIDRLTARIGATRPDWGQQAFRDAMPFLVRALSRVNQGPELRPVHEALFLQIVTDQDVSVPQWCAVAELAELQASYGLSTSSYAEQVDALGALLEPLGSVPMVVPALAFLERLCDLACPAAEARLRFATRLQAMLSALHGKVARSELALFAALGRLTGLQVTVPPPEDTPDAAGGVEALQGMTVALYSLNSSALERARRALLEEAPQLDVKCFSDTKGGSPALAQAAKTADLFVIATAAATHAATGFIELHRRDLPKRRVHRQGAAALLNEVRSFAAELRGVS